MKSLAKEAAAQELDSQSTTSSVCSKANASAASSAPWNDASAPPASR